MVKLSPLLVSIPLLFQLTLADPSQDIKGLCEKLRSLGLKKLSGYLSDVAKANTGTGQHLLSVLTTGGAGPLTLFAPTDQAFANFKVNLNDPDRLASVLSYHVVHGHFALAADDGKHDESFGATPVSPTQPLSPISGTDTNSPVPEAIQPTFNGGQSGFGSNSPIMGGTQPGMTNNQPGVAQPDVGNLPALANQSGQGGQPVFASDQIQNGQDQASSQQQPSPTDSPTPNIQSQLGSQPGSGATPFIPSSMQGNPSIPYDAPNHVVIGRTTLYNPSFVMLEGKDRGQVVAWSNVTGSDGKTRMLHQDSDCPVYKTTTYNDLVINVVPSVLYIPGSLPQLLARYNFKAFSSALKETTAPGMPYNLLDALDASNGYGAHGFTMFVASNEAMKRAKDMLPSIANNDPHAMATILQNHIINGTTVYSPTLCSTTFPYTTIASSGGPLTFISNNTGTFVIVNHDNGGPMYGAKILSTELLLQNGVVHVVDSVLMSSYRDDHAAAMAYEQAVTMAQQYTPENGPVGVPTGTSIGSGGAVVNAAHSQLDVLRNYGGWDLTRIVMIISVLMGIWFTTVPF